jgi:futalosine hydrolase
MLKKVLIVAATDTEAEALRMISGVIKAENCLRFRNLEIDLLVTGVGSVSTSWAMMKWFSSNVRPELAINIGIAGSYSGDIAVGDVVAPVSDCFADSGVETEGGFITLSEAGIADPFVSGGKIASDNIYTLMLTKMLKPVVAVTVNTVTGSPDTIQRISGKFNPGIETMEGATFFYICLREKIPFVALRSVSNRVEPRNRKKWDIPLAVSNLSEKLRDFLLMLD